MSHHAVITICVSYVHNFTANPSSVFHYGYRAYDELVCFPYCFVQKNQGCALTTLEGELEKSMLPNHSRYPPIEGKEFFAGFLSCCGAEEGGQLLISERLPENCPDNSRRTNEHRALNCCGSVRYWAKAELLLSRFCDWGVDYEPYQLFSQPFDGLMELDWVHDSTVETNKAE